MTNEIKLANGQAAIVDADMFEYLDSLRWHLIGHGYAATLQRINGKRVYRQMHRVVMGAPDGAMVDHKNGNKLDNRRENLRLATNSQNRANSKKLANSSSRFKGVSWDCVHKTWTARIRKNGTLHHLGHFRDEVRAALEYDRVAGQLHGEFAKLNFPQPLA